MTKSEVRMNKWQKFWARNKKSEGYLLKKGAMDYSYRICRLFMMFGLCFLILQPILNKISVSFMDEQDLYNTMVVNIPANFTTANYELAAQFMGYGEALRNTFIISLTIAILRASEYALMG